MNLNRLLARAKRCAYLVTAPNCRRRLAARVKFGGGPNRWRDKSWRQDAARLLAIGDPRPLCPADRRA